MQGAVKMAVGVLLACMGAVRLTEDAPPLGPPKPGKVAGILKPADRVLGLRAVSRHTGRTYRPKTFDRRTGAFVFEDLPGATTYDLCFRTPGGREIEGVDLDFVDARLVRLAKIRRRRLGLPPEREHEFGPEDVQALLGYVRDLKDFMEIRRVLYVRGHGRRATVLVELMRAREFYARKGDEVIWRVELWYFLHQFGGWERLANQERVLRRERIGEPKWRKISVEYFPQLGARVAADGSSRPVSFRTPEKPDLSRGRTPNSEIGVRTRPHISGVQTQPASAPAR